LYGVDAQMTGMSSGFSSGLIVSGTSWKIGGGGGAAFEGLEKNRRLSCVEKYNL